MCVEDDTAAEVSDPDLVCSNTYADPEYALATFCPMERDDCGD